MMAESQRTVIFLMGPTATGKTDLALQLHEKIPCELISVDSAMVYRGMDIGTAKPDKAILESVPHRLIDICDPAETYSAARFCDDALREIESIFQQGRIPLLVGGTGLYFRSLEQGLSPLPSADTDIRQRLEAEAAEQGWEAMHARLMAVDPETAARIHATDPQRIQRALEVYEITGRPMSSILAEGRVDALPFRIVKMILAPEDRGIIHERVKQRFQAMLDAGLVEEVKRLFDRGDLDSRKPSIRMVGYRQVWRYLQGDIGFQTMQEQAVVATRQLAKRQLTWCRSEQGATWYESTNSRILGKILANLQKEPEFSAMCNIITGI